MELIIQLFLPDPQPDPKLNQVIHLTALYYCLCSNKVPRSPLYIVKRIWSYVPKQSGSNCFLRITWVYLYLYLYLSHFDWSWFDLRCVTTIAAVTLSYKLMCMSLSEKSISYPTNQPELWTGPCTIKSPNMATLTKKGKTGLVWCVHWPAKSRVKIMVSW